METISIKAIYNLQRFSILQTKLNPATSELIPNSYAYAWFANIYPCLHDSDIHHDLKECFATKEKQVKLIAEIADKNWLSKKNLTYYEYEKLFREDDKYENYNISRVELLPAFRYFYLESIFDDDFWIKLLEKGEYPIEADSITNEFCQTDLYLL